MQAGGKIVYVDIEHIWVKAFVDYIPSRGAVTCPPKIVPFLIRV